jgi:ATP-dependent RNA helicase DeaD
MAGFKEIGVREDIVQVLEKLGIKSPTPVQEKAIPILMQGKDLVVRSKTGSGKTIAFLMPIIHQLKAEKYIQALILSPTRELALQIGKDLSKVSPNTKHLVIYGGVSIEQQISRLTEGGYPIIIGTPGRILDHVNRRTINFSHVRFFVLDEADRMLDMGFIEDIQEIMKHIPLERQTSLFSATVPEEIWAIAKRYMKNPERLILEKDEITVKNISQTFYGCARREKLDALMAYLKKHDIAGKKALIFVNTKTWADSLNRILYKKGYKVKTIHADLSQNLRERVMDEFKQGRFNVLVATDVAARGLHIPEVSHVINYDLPKDAKAYIHRIGRTGRAGATGDAVSFMIQEDWPALRNIEVELQKRLEVRDARELAAQHRHPRGEGPHHGE